MVAVGSAALLQSRLGKRPPVVALQTRPRGLGVGRAADVVPDNGSMASSVVRVHATVDLERRVTGDKAGGDREVDLIQAGESRSEAGERDRGLGVIARLVSRCKPAASMSCCSSGLLGAAVPSATDRAHRAHSRHIDRDGLANLAPGWTPTRPKSRGVRAAAMPMPPTGLLVKTPTEVSPVNA